ncbi:MAG: hypothetical protein ACTSWY_01475 [Promethearchaeota archaeon]
MSIIPKFPNDRDYFFDNRENIYQVLGYVHPQDSVFCLKKYEKISESEKIVSEFYWHSKKNDSFYKRIIHTYSARTAAKNINESRFRKLSQIYGTDFIIFPKKEISYYFSPKIKLRTSLENFRNGKFNALSKMTPQKGYALEIIYIIEEKFGISADNLGVTGSLLWEGIHKFSDIDIIIYGLKNTHNFIKNSSNLPKISSRFRELTTSEMILIGNKFSQKTGLSLEDCVVYTSKKRYLFYFDKYFLSIAFCPNQEEISKNPLTTKNTRFINEIGMENVTIRATVANTEWGFFYPSIVDIKEVVFIEEKRFKRKISPNICRIIIFERECSGYFKEGNNIEVKGLVQRIINAPPQLIISDSVHGGYKDGESREYYQIIIGTTENYGNEYIKNLDL